MSQSPKTPKKNPRQLSEYQQFRQARLPSRNDDDNHSAHFQSNNTDREEQLHPITKIYLNRNANNVSGFNRDSERERELAMKLQEKEKECNQIYAKFGELMTRVEEVQRERDYYKRKYEERVARDKETKRKLEGWIKEARTDLIDTVQRI